MKLIINGKTYVKKYKTGVQRYCIEILKQLDLIANKNDKVELIVPSYCKNIPNFLNIKVVKYGKLKPNIWEQIELPRYVKKNNGLLVNLCNTSPIINPGIVCIHDIDFIRNKKLYPRLFYYWYKIMINNAIKNAKKIITVSNFSKDEIEDYYKIKNKVYVVSNSFEHIFEIKSDNSIFLENKNIKKNQYFFTLGTVQKNKNIKLILKLAKQNQDKQFVITGYKNQRDIEFDLKNVIYTGYISDEKMKALMENCKAYIMPSLYEGFGLPVIEAFSLGKEVLVSNIPVMHEIFENEAIYFDPNDSKIDLNNIKISKNRDEILKKYSWRKSAKTLYKIVKKMLI